MDEAEEYLRRGIKLNQRDQLSNEEMEGRLFLRQLHWRQGIADDPLTSDEAIDALWSQLYHQDLMAKTLLYWALCEHSNGYEKET